MKLRLYLDTSVFSARIDDRAPDRRACTEDFWKTLPDYEPSTSDLAVEELRQTADPQLRARMEAMLADFAIIPVSDAMRSLADQYILAGAFTRTMLNDAIHVAAATLSRQDILVSWNFKHLVNRRRRAMVASVNTGEGLPLLDILTLATAMRYFDYQNVAREAGMAPAHLCLLVERLRAETPQDPMLAELHILRACMAIKAVQLTVEQALADTEPTALAA